jgi:hypothetical protein
MSPRIRSESSCSADPLIGAGLSGLKTENFNEDIIRIGGCFAAQAAIRNDRRWTAPYYWAGFVLQDEWR